MHEDLYFCHVSAEESAKPTALVGLADPDSLASQSAWPTPLWLAQLMCMMNSQIGLAKLLVMLGMIYMIGGLPYWHIYEIQVPKLIKVFGKVLSNMRCTMMSFAEEPLKTCC
jgi:hypothetical protein